MRKKWFGLALFVLACAPVVSAQNPSHAENAFRDSVLGRQWVLRNYSGEDKVHATWAGTEMTLDESLWHTLAEVEVNTVELTGHTLVMSCTRHVLVRDDTGKIQLFAPPTPIEISVDFGSANPATMLPKLKDDLFYASTDEALSALPKQVSAILPARLDFSPREERDAANPPCDCATDDRSACDAEHRKINGIVAPKYLSGRDAHFTREARRHRGLDAHVNITLEVDTAGRPQDVWIVTPVGYGLDEEAAKSVLTYKFLSATCHDKPAAVPLNVQTRFRLY